MQFRQSVTDFPLTVRLGEKTPAWGLNRWPGQGLRFVPPDDEGYALRGDKQRFVYKGRLRSHRFTILGDSSFEYDCILNKEPESNVISLFMEGAEHFEFLRQPDFVRDPFLKGSYAVYKKETLIGEGTGKLCHIHRPLIIDARGRRVWGELFIKGNCLCITIPENWLSEAKYPVIVDPVVGTTTVGSQTKWVTIASNGIEHYCLLGALIVNRFLFPESYNGTVTAYLYVYDKVSMSGCKPVLYSDNNNIPLDKLSSNEGNIDVSVSGTNAAGWRSSSFNINSNIQSGSYIWYGISAALFYPRFDYGEKLYWYSYDNYAVNLPTTFPLFPDGRFYDYKVSMYFDYTTAQNYVRTLTQGVTLTDNRKLTAEYKRDATETVQANGVVNRLQTFYRKLQEAVQGLENNSCSFLFFRSVKETTTVSETIKHLGAFFRGFTDNAKIECEAKSGRVYFLTLTDTVQAAGVVFRGLLLFVRIATGLFVKDYILRQFLIAREDLTLKSCITREMTIESKIN